ncbi:MAG TPA: hypothetical protein VES40_04435 [Ilumatobacteraceae bacterium]|nr:hypothetical protein [Ilumatobacteraceae bacterium]
MSLSDVMGSVARTTESTFDRIDRDAVTAALPDIDFAGIAAAVSPAVHAISDEVAHAASRAWRTRPWILVAAGAVFIVIGIVLLRRWRRSSGGIDTLPEDRADTARLVPSHRPQGAEAPATTRGSAPPVERSTAGRVAQVN